MSAPGFFPPALKRLCSAKQKSRSPAIRRYAGPQAVQVDRPPVNDRHRGSDGRGHDNSKGKSMMANIGSFKKSGNRVPGRDRYPERTSQKRPHRPGSQPEQRQGAQPPRLSRSCGDRSRLVEASAEGRDYISITLDDPSFNAPIQAGLFGDEDSEGFTSSGLAAANPAKTNPPYPRRPAQPSGAFSCQRAGGAS